jgi:hypothetical protein
MTIIKPLRDLIILSIVLTSLPTYADYMVCDAGGNNCTNVHEGSGSTSSSGFTGTTQNQPASQAGGYQDNGPGKFSAYAQAAAAAEKGKLLNACGEKKARITKFTNTYQACNSTTQLAYNASFGDCPAAVQQGSTWGVKTKDGTTFGYSRETAQNAGAQCRADASTIYTTTMTNVCLANYNADKEAEGQLSQFCKDAGF